jgi:hypothetical protein
VKSAATRAAETRRRSAAIMEQSRKLLARAESMPPGIMRSMLEGQARLLAEGARALEAQALAMTPPAGSA